MAKLSEESLNKLTNSELIAFSMNLQEKNELILHDVKDQVRELKEYVKKLEGELVLSKNISEPLSGRLVNMEKHCWSNAQYSRRECVEVAGKYLKVFQQVTWKKLFLKFWRKLGWKF